MQAQAWHYLVQLPCDVQESFHSPFQTASQPSLGCLPQKPAWMDFQLNFAKDKLKQKIQVGSGCEVGHFISQLSPCRDPSSWLQPPQMDPTPQKAIFTQPLCLQVLGRIVSPFRTSGAEGSMEQLPSLLLTPSGHRAYLLYTF